jgi:hypothetical protein
LFGTVPVPPHVVGLATVTPVFAVLVSSAFVAAMFRLRAGNADQSRATTPATCGAAIDVPLRFPNEVSLELSAERTLTPGATTSGFTRFEPSAVTGPRLLKPASALLTSTAPVVKEAE